MVNFPIVMSCFSETMRNCASRRDVAAFSKMIALMQPYCPGPCITENLMRLSYRLAAPPLVEDEEVCSCRDPPT